MTEFKVTAVRPPHLKTGRTTFPEGKSLGAFTPSFRWGLGSFPDGEAGCALREPQTSAHPVPDCLHVPPSMLKADCGPDHLPHLSPDQGRILKFWESWGAFFGDLIGALSLFGVLNPFNELIREAKAGKNPFSLHHIPFSKAVKNGLYKRVCQIKGKEWSPEAEADWEELIRSSYGPRTASMKQELDAIPAEAEGSALTRVQIEACMEDGIPVVSWLRGDEFKNTSEHVRKADALDFCREKLRPILDGLNKDLKHVMGEDFARKGDATDIVIFEIGNDLVRRAMLVVELRNIPFDQQRDILFYVCDRIPKFVKGAMDAGGNGAYLAEKATQRYGEKIIEVSFSQEWYRQEMPPYIEAFADSTVVLPRHDDVMQDHQALQYVNGIIRIPKDFRFKGSDGLDRHGDSAVAFSLAWFASRQKFSTYDYMSVHDLDDDEDDDWSGGKTWRGWRRR